MLGILPLQDHRSRFLGGEKTVRASDWAGKDELDITNLRGHPAHAPPATTRGFEKNSRHAPATRLSAARGYIPRPTPSSRLRNACSFWLPLRNGIHLEIQQNERLNDFGLVGFDRWPGGDCSKGEASCSYCGLGLCGLRRVSQLNFQHQCFPRVGFHTQHQIPQDAG